MKEKDLKKRDGLGKPWISFSGCRYNSALIAASAQQNAFGVEARTVSFYNLEMILYNLYKR